VDVVVSHRFGAGVCFLFTIFILPAAPASQPQPYSLPNFDNKDKDFHVVELGALPAVRYDFDAVFSKVEQCFPIRSYFSDSVDLTVTSNQLSAVTSNQINPLYSIPFEGGSSERRLIILEAELRLKIITLISDYFQSIEQVQYNNRALQFYLSLEQRAKERVKRGIVAVDEQVTYLEKVIKTEHDLTEWKVKFDASRLSLTAFCKDSERDKLNQYLSQYVK